MIYEPAEDSFLLEEHVRRNSFGRVLDVGTGSGIQALAALSNHDVGEVIAIDINPEVVNQFNQKIKEKNLRKIKVFQSNLFENVSGKFNTIIFNPPYLPQDNGVEDFALYGGKKGWEISKFFFKNVSKYLSPEGKIFFLFSSLTNKVKIEEFISDNLLQFEEIDRLKIPFEFLYVYEITKTKLLRDLESKNLENIHYFTKGKRGVIYTGTQDKSSLIKTHLPSKKDIFKVAIKTKRKDSDAINRIQNESNWLRVLNQKGIGPKFLFSQDNFLVYKFVEGIFILDWVKENSKNNILKIIADILNQCFIMDKIGITKEEMHHPLKHIIITKHNNPILLDFERTSRTLKPKNVTQFVEFICRMDKELELKSININKEQLRNLANEYKETFDQTIIQEILKAIQ